MTNSTLRSTARRASGACLLLLATVAHAADPSSAPARLATDPVLRTLQLELDRLARDLRQAPSPAYFLAYQLTDNRAVDVVASFGALVDSDDRRSRSLDVDLRVGEPGLDNTRQVDGERGERPGAGPGPALPLDDDPITLRVALWRETERRYRDAVQALERVRASVRTRVEREDRSGDFSPMPAEVFEEPEAPFAFDRRAWEQRLRAATAPFARRGEITGSRASVSAQVETRRYVNSEGSLVRTSGAFYRLDVSATAKAEDGMELPLHRSWLALRPEGLPDDAAIAGEVGRMVELLLALRQAPMAEPFTGPALLSGRAAAVFFHEIFGHRIEGHRQKAEEEAQTFKKRLGQPVLPPFLSVYSDPTATTLGGVDLAGAYRFDDEGVRAQRVTVVKDGVLRSFLVSRAPIQGFERSNGHGRRQQGHAVVARQSNLIVEASQAVPRERLKALLIERAREAGKPYGLLFDDIAGGFTFTARVLPNAFNVRPTVVYRVRLDGSEELVRGVDLIGTPLIAFSKIVAAGDEPAIFNGVCGAESGWVPVSAVSPSLLVSQIEVQRKEKSQQRPPLLPPPPAVPGS